MLPMKLMLSKTGVIYNLNFFLKFFKRNDYFMIILFDGICNLCEASVKFIIKRDKKGKFRFVAFQSVKGSEILEKNNYSNKKFDTLILLKERKIYTKSTAALLIAKELHLIWKLFYIFIIIPKFLRDPIYLFISKNRYKWFGKKGSCLLPSPKIKSRFLE